jgi:succinate-acetate transporter protein
MVEPEEHDDLGDEGFRKRVVEVLVQALDGTGRFPSGPPETGERSGSYGRFENIAATRVFLRPLANPLSLGFLGLFFATMLFTSLELGWVPASDSHTLAEAVLVFTVPVQVIACVYGFLTRDTVAATGMGVLFGTWGGLALGTLLSRPGTHSSAVAFALVMGAVALCMPGVAALQSKALAGAVTLVAALRWAVTAAFEFSGSTDWKTAAGAFGLLLGMLALYSSLAFELEDQHRSTVLPTFRHSLGAVAMQNDLSDQVSGVANEAGVRKQL